MCGAEDPAYVAPEEGEEPACEHSIAEGVCTKCGALEKDIVIPENEEGVGKKFG